MNIDQLKTWIGKTEEAADCAAAAPLLNLAALLDHAHWPWPADRIPPLAHWLYFQPAIRQSTIGEDGHPKRGRFLPPVALPRRMWAGGSVEFHRPIAIGAAMKRHSRITGLDRKSGASGELVFVTVEHEIRVGSDVAIRERQDLVYRGPSASVYQRSEPAERRSVVTRPYRADPVVLFRFSAITFNGHRIHYDRDYARDTEGYPGLVVHGPFQATLLMDLLLRERPGFEVRQFDFRAHSPMFDTQEFTLNFSPTAGGAELWIERMDGGVAMTASIAGEQHDA